MRSDAVLLDALAEAFEAASASLRRQAAVEAAKGGTGSLILRTAHWRERGRCIPTSVSARLR